jgi:GDP-L-fucose synthase
LEKYGIYRSTSIPSLKNKKEISVNSCNSWTVSLKLWGTGTSRREFLYVDDLADAVVFLMNNYNATDIGEFVNIGMGKDITIKELAEIVKEIVGFKGEIEWDTSKPDGTPQKLLNVERIHKLGWKAKISLKDGIIADYKEYADEINSL